MSFDVFNPLLETSYNQKPYFETTENNKNQMNTWGWCFEKSYIDKTIVTAGRETTYSGTIDSSGNINLTEHKHPGSIEYKTEESVTWYREFKSLEHKEQVRAYEKEIHELRRKNDPLSQGRADYLSDLINISFSIVDSAYITPVKVENLEKYYQYRRIVKLTKSFDEARKHNELISKFVKESNPQFIELFETYLNLKYLQEIKPSLFSIKLKKEIPNQIAEYKKKFFNLIESIKPPVEELRNYTDVPGINEIINTKEKDNDYLEFVFSDVVPGIVHYIKTNRSDLVIPEKVNGVTIKEIWSQVEQSVLDDNGSVKSISFPNSQIKLNSHSFYKTNIEEIKTFGGIKEISRCCFAETKLKKVELPEGITKIGYWAFSNCEYLEEVILPSTLELIDEGAFYPCLKLAKVHFRGTIEKWKSVKRIIGWNGRGFSKGAIPAQVVHCLDGDVELPK